MALSLGVVLAGVFVFVFLVMPRGDEDPAVQVVDNAPASVTAFARQAPYAVLAPAGLGADLWKPTSLRVALPGGSRPAPDAASPGAGDGQALDGSSAGSQRTGSGVTGTASSANLAELSIGYVIDRPKNRTYARYVVSNAPDAVRGLLGNRPVTGSTVVDGTTWQERADDVGHLALTRTVDAVTVIIDDGSGAGGAKPADLSTLAGSLRPVVTNTTP